jgi:adenosylhomocysteine nucleosidase
MIKMPSLVLAAVVESQGIFEKNRIEAHYCGIGKVNAAYYVTKMISAGATSILNLGTAGSHKFPAHSVVQCKSFVQRDMDLSPLGFPRGATPLDPTPTHLGVQTLDLGLPWAVCGTGDNFENGPAKLNCDIVDMEGFAMAKVCYRENVPFYSYKYITDGSDEKAHLDWTANLKRASLALFEIYQEFGKKLMSMPEIHIHR